jgi:NAD(P)-dependent dehydrogenase (short-subunit alcohol dehydrogenase family)
MPTALVTGGNRGIGFEVCRGLGKRDYRVLLAARDSELGEKAAAELRRDGLNVEARVLDVTDRSNIDALARSLSDGPLDVLVNNAGIALDGFDANVVRRTLATNVHGALDVTDALTPHLSRGARVVMVSSGLGALEGLAPRVRARFDPPESRDAILQATRDFLHAVERGTEASEGWPRSAYRISKVALNALTRILADEFRERGVLVNAVCPGWVRTRMGGPSASRSSEEGARGIIWAATLPPDGPTGGFFRDGHLQPF